MSGLPESARHARNVRDPLSADDAVATHATLEPNSAVDEHGRTYQTYRPGKYLLPNDALEQDRLDAQHCMFHSALNGPHLAPVDRPQLVLDVGTGTGVWAREYAQDHPDARVVGTDLSLIQPKPDVPNCSFFRHDVDDPWRPDTADYIHVRDTAMWFRDLPAVVATCFRHLRPGGYLELQDLVLDLRSHDGTHHGTHIQTFYEAVSCGLANLGLDATLPRRYRDVLVAAGFADVREAVVPIPINGWPADGRMKDIGKLRRLTMGKGIQLMPTFLQAAGLDEKAALDLTQRALADANNRNIHAYFPLYVVYGRKPAPPPQQQPSLVQWPVNALGSSPPPPPPPPFATTPHLFPTDAAWYAHHPYEYMAMPPVYQTGMNGSAVLTEEGAANTELAELMDAGLEPGGPYMMAGEPGRMRPRAW